MACGLARAGLIVALRSAADRAVVGAALASFIGAVGATAAAAAAAWSQFFGSTCGSYIDVLIDCQLLLLADILVD